MNNKFEKLNGMNNNYDVNQDSRSIHTMELTPQPDNYSCIKSCPHIISVLESNAKNTVFETYKQAVLISQPISNKVYHSKKDHSLIPQSKILSSKIKSLKCNECHLDVVSIVITIHTPIINLQNINTPLILDQVCCIVIDVMILLIILIWKESECR